MVRRLNRYKRESLNHKAPPPRPTMENKTRDTKQYTETLSNLSLSTQQNGFVQDQRTPGKTHIMENPFKTIKVALIRQKKASNNAKTAKVPPTSQQDQKSTTRGEAAEKPKLCQVKRVALIKISPARPRFRGISSSSRSITNSPKPGRRKSYFEGLQHRRKSPKVRRRHAEPDDSLSSVGSNSRRRDSLLVKKPSHHDVRGRSESKQNHELGSPGEKNERISENDTENKNFTEELPCGQANTPIISTKDGKAPSTVTHLYTDKGVVLKRNPPETNGKIESKAETILEQDHVQHHVFHSNSKEIIEKAKETTEAIMETTGTIMDAKGTIMDTKVTIKETTGNAKQTTGIMKEKGRITKESAVNAKESNQNAKENTGNTKDTRETQKHQGNKGVIMRNPEGTFEKTEQSIRLVNAKISSIPTKKDVERLEPISPQLNSSGSPTSQRTPEREPSPKGACSQRKPDEKVVTFKRASTKYLNPSKIPVLAGKYSPDQQNPRSPGRLSPRIPSMSSSSPKPLRTIPRKNDVSTLTDKYNKCFSVVVVNSSSNNTALNRVKKSGGNETKAKTEKNETVEKKNNEIDTRAVPVKTSTSVLSPPTRSNSEESPSPKLSTRSSEKGSLVKGSITSKDLKRDSQARQRVEVNENGKLPSVGESSKNQFQTSSPTKEAKQRQSWTGDERRKISNYKKTNDTQQMKSVRREVRTPGTSYRNRTFRPSS